MLRSPFAQSARPPAHHRRFVAVVLLVGLAVGARTLAAQDPPIRFERHELATGIRGGYQVVATDMDADGDSDLLAVGTGNPDLLWLENPSPAEPGTAWRSHVVATGLRAMINAGARDIDGDGIPEIALAYGFATVPARSVGNVAILSHNGDPTALWSLREIDRVPAAHRLRWLDTGTEEGVVLVNAPLAGEFADEPDYRDSTPIYYYRPSDWERRVMGAADSGVVHGIEAVRWPGSSAEGLLAASFLGLSVRVPEGGAWRRVPLHPGNGGGWPEGGSSDVALGALGADPFLAAIEPWHGNEVVVYTPAAPGWERQVVDAALEDGHTLLTADFDGDGSDEIVAGDRAGSSVIVYTATAGGSGPWLRTVIDDGRVAAAGCAAADLDLDGATDLVCIGTATANVVWYRNLGRG